MSLGCNMVPIGFYDPKGRSLAMDIEWQCHFVRAEQALLNSLGHSQVRKLTLNTLF